MEQTKESNSPRVTKELHIAPMLDVSYREFRFLMRLLTKRAILWTEMVVDETLVHSKEPQWHTTVDPVEHPIICQLGGNRPDYAKIATRLIAYAGYDGIDLNCECPSYRVASSRAFGAALMKHPQIAVDMVRAIRSSSLENETSLAMSVKMRIGVDDHDSWEFLSQFVEQLMPSCQRFIIHARKVYTTGLNPDQNRRIPPLNYEMVYRLCRRFPSCHFILNGGINSLKEAKAILYGSNDDDDDHCHNAGTTCENEIDSSRTIASYTKPLRDPPPNLIGVMMGRAARDHPTQFWDADRFVFGCQTPHRIRNRRQLLDAYCAYIEKSYPRRCCDNDDEHVTSRYPPPAIVHTAPYCTVCHSVNYDKDSIPCCDRPRRRQQQQKNTKRSMSQHCLYQPAGTIKITSNVMDRSFKPILGVLFGFPGSRAFRNHLFELLRDLSIRNCGPAFVLRHAMATISNDLLDRPF